MGTNIVKSLLFFLFLRMDLKNVVKKTKLGDVLCYSAHYDSPLGGITLGSDGVSLTGLWFDGQRFFADGLGEEYEERADLTIFCDTCRWLDMYFGGRMPNFTPPLLLRATPFRQRVWQLLLDIPYGQTVTYGSLARQLGCRSAQAVGGAVGHNPISLIIPCHRVVGTGGMLTGYAGGLDLKMRLLEMEKTTSNEITEKIMK